MSVEERLRQQGVKVNGTLDIRAGFKVMSKAFVDEYGVIINFKFPEDEQEGGGGRKLVRQISGRGAGNYGTGSLKSGRLQNRDAR